MYDARRGGFTSFQPPISEKGVIGVSPLAVERDKIKKYHYLNERHQNEDQHFQTWMKPKHIL